MTRSFDSRRRAGGLRFSAALLLAGALSFGAGCSDDKKSATDGHVQGNDSQAPGGDSGVGTDAKTRVGDGAVNTDQGISDAKPQGTGTISLAEITRIAKTLSADDMDGRGTGTPGGAAARKFIIDELKACGVEPAGLGGTFEQRVTTGKGTNILGMIKGSGTAEQVARTIVLSAHYDHLGHCGGDICNGADDNAAAVAIVLQVACALAKKPPARSVLVASWDAEEPPSFLKPDMGSAFWVANPTIPLDRLDAAMVLDLAGGDLWPGFEGHFILGSELSPAVDTALKAATLPTGLEAFPVSLQLIEKTAMGHQAWSDYDAFRNKQIPILFLTNGQNKRYHTVADEFASLNLPKITLEAQYLLAIMRQLGDAAGATSPTFDARGVDHLRDALAIKVVLEAALLPTGLIANLTGTSKRTLERDLAAITALGRKLKAGDSASASEVSALRAATQHIMCLAGSTNSEFICNLL